MMVSDDLLKLYGKKLMTEHLIDWFVRVSCNGGSIRFTHDDAIGLFVGPELIYMIGDYKPENVARQYVSCLPCAFRDSFITSLVPAPVHFIDGEE